MATYDRTASAKVGDALHDEKRGTLKSGRAGPTVTSREQAIAIGLSEARKAGAKAPDSSAAPKKIISTKTVTKKPAAKKAGGKTALSKKVPKKKAPAKTATGKKAS